MNMTGVLTERRLLDTKTHSEGRQCEETPGDGGNPPVQELLRLPESRGEARHRSLPTLAGAYAPANALLSDL